MLTNPRHVLACGRGCGGRIGGMAVGFAHPLPGEVAEPACTSRSPSAGGIAILSPLDPGARLPAGRRATSGQTLRAAMTPTTRRPNKPSCRGMSPLGASASPVLGRSRLGKPADRCPGRKRRERRGTAIG